MGRRIRGFLRAPTPKELMDVGAAEHLHLTDDESAAYSEILAGVLTQLDRLDELVATQPGARYLVRDPGRRPQPEEDPFNAFTRFCRVPGAEHGPLSGLRAAVKDNLAVAGVPITNASRTSAYVPVSDAVVVERLLDAGATIVGKLNMDDFATSGTGESSWFGPPRNPVDPTRSAGGSSGGSGSAVASGTVDISIGVDEGGSARIPASFCGVVSLKATHGLIPSHGLTYMDHTIDSVCPTAATVDLVARVTDVIAGHDDRDPQWVRGMPAPTSCAEAVGEGVARLKIGVVDQGVDESLCEPDVLARFRDGLDVLTDAGAEVVPVSIPLWADAWPIELAMLFHLAWAMAQSEGMGFGHLGEIDVARAHAFALSRRLEADEFPPFLKVWLLAGRWLHDHYFSTYFGKAQNLRRALRDEISAALTTCDLLVTPTTPHTAPALLDRPGTDAELLARGTTMSGNTAPLNLSGHPALAVPCGVDAAGLPVSMQIIARHFADAMCFRAGSVVTSGSPSVRSPPDRVTSSVHS
jgi:amidase